MALPAVAALALNAVVSVVDAIAGFVVCTDGMRRVTGPTGAGTPCVDVALAAQRAGRRGGAQNDRAWYVAPGASGR